MKFIDNYLDGYLARKICYLCLNHYGADNIRIDYDSAWQQYRITLKPYDKDILVFRKRESLFTLRKLLAEGWQ